MSDETLDGSQALEGTPASPNAGGSQGNGVSGGSSAGQPQTDVEALNRKLGEMEKQLRSLQGDKDRSVNQTKKEVEELKRQFAEISKLQSKGLELDDAIEEYQLREDIRQLRSQLQSGKTAQPSPAGNGNGLAVDKAKTLQQYGLSENDADVAAELGGKDFTNPLELENAALRIAFKRANKPLPDASAASSINTGRVVSGMGDDQANALLGEMAQLYKEPTKNAARIQLITKQLKEAGKL